MERRLAGLSSAPDASGKTARVLTVAGVWLVLVVVGLVGVELYARNVKGYRLWSVPLESRQPYFFELDRLKVYNRRFVEQRRDYFRDWPIPLELFDSDKPTPRYLFKPNLRMAVKNGKLVPAQPGDEIYRTSNSWGFRGPEFSVQKPPGLIRIVCLGASTTEGSQGDLETYPHFLQQELDRAIPGRKVEVLNAGYHGQGIDDLLEILRLRVLPLKPDVILFYEVANNIGWREFLRGDLSCPTGSCGPKVYSGLYALLSRHSAIFALAAQRFGWNEPAPVTPWHEFDESSPKPAAEQFRKVLREIVSESLAGGSRIVLSSFITLAHDGLTVRREDNALLYDYIHKTMSPFTPGEIARIYAYYDRVVHEVAQELRVPFVDTAAEFPREAKYFPFDLIHLSPEGNRVVARILARHLRSNLLSWLLGTQRTVKE